MLKPIKYKKYKVIIAIKNKLAINTYSRQLYSYKVFRMNQNLSRSKFYLFLWKPIALKSYACALRKYNGHHRNIW